ncbi:MAG: hypothetical protein KatS3mg109_0327 [Pirellulaceae bacterium]|nr:MAG: hypothetical protein KatS3mg109_0327 [Pirellulaceae bacterium]
MGWAPRGLSREQSVILGELPGETAQQRILVIWHRPNGPGVAQPTDPSGDTDRHSNCIELCEQAWGPGVGWYTYSSVRLSPRQVGLLRSLLGRSGYEAQRIITAAETVGLRVVRAESA